MILAFDLPLCRILLGLDGLIRNGAPLVVAAALTLYALWRTAHAPARTIISPGSAKPVAQTGAPRP